MVHNSSVVQTLVTEKWLKGIKLFKQLSERIVEDFFHLAPYDE